MKIKKLLGTLVAGAALLAAGTATADTLEINITGASAQGTFWNALAPDFIKAQPGCSGATVTHKQLTGDSNFQATFATCGGNTYIIRQNSKASFDGPLSLMGNDDYANPGAFQEKCESGDPGFPGATDAPYYRKMVNEDLCSGSTCTALKCVRITIGASDVAAESFTQNSHGRVFGPATPVSTPSVDRNFSGIDASTLESAKPFVVPFSFMVNNSVPITNLTRLQAVLLFSGQIKNWNEFGSSYPDLPTKICYRHAGSGTHGAIDYTVIQGNGWGATMAGFENRPDETVPDYPYDPNAPIIYFNDSTKNLLDCVNGVGIPGYSAAGAIGYADADKANPTTHAVSGCTPGACANVTAVKYQGEYASRDAIKNGVYDYWVNEWAYYKTSAQTTAQAALVQSLLTFAGDPSKIPASEVAFWAVQSEMKFNKDTDQLYPKKQ